MAVQIASKPRGTALPAPHAGRPPGRLAWTRDAACWAVAAVVAALASPRAGVAVFGVGVLATLAARRDERRRWVEPVRRISDYLDGTSDAAPDASDPALSALVVAAQTARSRAKAAISQEPRPRRSPTPDLMTRSGMFEAPPEPEGTPFDPNASADFSSLDIINRLDPRSLRWVDSSAAEQAFLGWTLDDLRAKSFLDVVHPEDRDLARDQLLAAVLKGEAHGLVYRVRTADGEQKAVEMNVGVRYGPGMVATYLRCHVTDVTAKLRASHELRRRTRELMLLNQKLIRANRDLAELKDRYGDLYQNAPAMYYSTDADFIIIDCNDTMLRTLGYGRADLIGEPYAKLVAPDRVAGHHERRERLIRDGRLEMETEWLRSDGSPLRVWINASAVIDAEGVFKHSRSMAQDVTARRLLEDQVREKAARLAAANDELSRKNRELDEFTHVVSHDLQEPLRTLIAFSDFLLRDYGEKIDAEGQDYVRYLVEASRRMRSLIQDLLRLSRAGKVTGEFGRVDLGRIVEEARADLAELIRSKGAEFAVVGPLPALWGDGERIGQLVRNLMTNGLKYNRSEPPRVEVGAGPGRSPAWCEVYVRDNGIGIDPQFHARIFQLFRRLHAREEYEGTGAGLAICQKIAQAHGGEIRVESAVGRGSTFYVALPRAAAAGPGAEPNPP